MIPHSFYYHLVFLGLLWLCVLLHAAWPSRGSAAQQRPATSILPRRQRSKAPPPFAGLTDHVWTLREVLLFRVPPWPQPAGI